MIAILVMALAAPAVGRSETLAGASRAVIAQWVQGAAAPASAGRHGQWLTEAPQQQDPHAWAREPEPGRSGKHRDGVRTAGACLGEQPVKPHQGHRKGSLAHAHVCKQAVAARDHPRKTSPRTR